MDDVESRLSCPLCGDNRPRDLTRLCAHLNFCESFDIFKINTPFCPVNNCNFAIQERNEFADHWCEVHVRLRSAKQSQAAQANMAMAIDGSTEDTDSEADPAELVLAMEARDLDFDENIAAHNPDIGNHIAFRGDDDPPDGRS